MKNKRKSKPAKTMFILLFTFSVVLFMIPDGSSVEGEMWGVEKDELFTFDMIVWELGDIVLEGYFEFLIVDKSDDVLTFDVDCVFDIDLDDAASDITVSNVVSDSDPPMYYPWTEGGILLPSRVIVLLFKAEFFEVFIENIEWRLEMGYTELEYGYERLQEDSELNTASYVKYQYDERGLLAHLESTSTDEIGKKTGIKISRQGFSQESNTLPGFNVGYFLPVVFISTVGLMFVKRRKN